MTHQMDVCQHCLKIILNVEKIEDLQAEFKSRSIAIRRQWHSWPILRSFAPKIDRREFNYQIFALEQEIKSLKVKDGNHWKEDISSAVSAI